MEKMEHIITPDEIRKLGRPIGNAVDAAQLESYITEAEQMYVKPVLGDALFLDILKEGQNKYDTLLFGGTYEYNGGVYSFVGLRVAISYYVYAQNVMVGDFQSTRYGMVVKQNDYSQPLSHKERSDAYSNALEVANSYLRECVTYCKRTGLIVKGGRATASGNIRIRKIG